MLEYCAILYRLVMTLIFTLSSIYMAGIIFHLLRRAVPRKRLTRRRSVALKVRHL